MVKTRSMSNFIQRNGKGEFALQKRRGGCIRVIANQ